MAETSDLTRIVSNDLINCGFKVATNKRNTLNLPQFHTIGVGNSVPDLFFWDEAYENEIFDANFVPNKTYHIRAGFVELKPGNHFREILEGVFQNTRYYKYFITNKAIFLIDGIKINNADAFFLCSKWSRTGRIYKGDDDLPSFPIPYISERYNITVPPYTRMIHSLQRYLQNQIRFEIKKEKINIANNKINTQVGLMISKIPYDEEEKISYEYYGWLGNVILPVVAKTKYSPEYTKTKVKVLHITRKALLIETKYQKKDWIPISQVELVDNDKSIKIGDWFDIKVTLSYYKKNENIFGSV